MLAEIPSISTADVDFGLFIITVILVILTWLNVRAANKLIKLQTEPFVHVELNWGLTRGEELRLEISIKNRGGGPARDINFVGFKDDFEVSAEVIWGVLQPRHPIMFSQTYAAKHGIKELAPYQEMLLVQLPEVGGWKEHRYSEIFFEYKTESGKLKTASSILNFSVQAAVYERQA